MNLFYIPISAIEDIHTKNVLILSGTNLTMLLLLILKKTFLFSKLKEFSLCNLL
jgi:hypothetical protein